MINCIVAVDRDQGIGLNGSMPWPRLADDMRWFKEKTLDQIIIMGRKTWESIGSKPLPDRVNIVLSNSKIQGATSTNDPTWVPKYCKIFYPYKEIYIIGGGKVYHHYLETIDRFYVTEIDFDYKCDTKFPLDYVKKTCSQVNELYKFSDPVPYTINEYTK